MGDTKSLDLYRSGYNLIALSTFALVDVPCPRPPPLLVHYGNLGKFRALVGPFFLFRHLKKIYFVLRANVLFLTGANVPLFGQMSQKSRGKCFIFGANVPFLTWGKCAQGL